MSLVTPRHEVHSLRERSTFLYNGTMTGKTKQISFCDSDSRGGGGGGGL